MPQLKKVGVKPATRSNERDKYLTKPLTNTPAAHGVFQSRPLHLLVLAVLLVIIAGPSLLPNFSVIDNDIWWHLKVGDWIVDHLSVPHNGILSRTAADRPWMAYSWMYEVLLSLFHSAFHLVGISLYGLLLTLGAAYSILWMTRRLSGSFWRACLLSVATCAAFLFNVLPRPVFFSMILFTVTLTLLLEAQRGNRPRLLYWLPPLFVLWANLHIQFVYGLFAVGLFVAVNLLARVTPRIGLGRDFGPPQCLRTSTLVVILGGCVLATCVGPYSYHLYFVILGYVRATFPYTYISEFQALRFRNYTDFVQLLLTGLAFLALGRRKTVDPFLLLLLTIASVVGFRTARDSWFVCIPAAACIATAIDAGDMTRRDTITEKAVLGVSVALLLVLYARGMDVNSPNLRLAINEIYPVQAINFLRDHPQRGPLYNTFDWGGFISWYMPEYPVAIDGRTDLYGDEIDTRFYMTENGAPSYVNDSYLNQANLIVLPRKKPLAIPLASDSRFTEIYQDSLTVVFVRR